MGLNVGGGAGRMIGKFEPVTGRPFQSSVAVSTRSRPSFGVFVITHGK